MSHFVTKGDKPLTPVQLERRAQTYIKRSWPAQDREKSIRLSDGAFDAFMASFSADHDVNVANNTFNWQLQEYGTAVARLDRYVLADGRPEVWEDQPTGEFDDMGEPILVATVTQTAVEPLVATVEQTTYDMDGVATVATVANPLIVTDDEERAAAQAVVDGTPTDVVAFVS
jgi:hypothetical protein